jgi:uncharacterized integral membrane protein
MMTFENTTSIEPGVSSDRQLVTVQTMKFALGAVLMAAIVLFGVVNTHDVGVDWVVAETITALWIVIVVSAVVGFVAGYITSYRRR